MLAARIAALVLAVLTVAAAPAAAARRPPVTRGSTYLALGDSVTFGYQEATVVPAPDYTHARHFTGYPELTGSALHLHVANASCPGETSASLVNASAPSNGCEGASGYRGHFPLHARYSGSQLAYAVRFLRRHRGTRLVSLMIGANDLFLCQKTTSDGCGSAAERSAVLANLASNVRRILSGVRNTAHYRGQVAIVTYYSLDYSSPTINTITAGLNGAVRKAAGRFHVVVADGFGTLRAAAAHSGGSTCNAGLLTQLGRPGTCGVHPSYSGSALLAQALMKAIRVR